MTVNTYLVTGANRGIGLEYCRQLRDRGEQVIGVCRQSSEALNDLGIQVEKEIELTNDNAISDLVQRLSGRPLHCVILNAGMRQSMGLEDLDPHSIRHQFE